MLAIPMCLLYELGILRARLISKPRTAASPSGDMAPTIAAMDRELDRIETGERDSR
jgi:Sec-independent protein secretion pathway component TatC